METLLVEINGESRDVQDSITLSELILQLALAPERLAVELNHRVVRRTDWQQTTITEGDRIEIVHFVGGGNKDRNEG
jgi:thiamine biosynthesis protein ThiS